MALVRQRRSVDCNYVYFIPPPTPSVQRSQGRGAGVLLQCKVDLHLHYSFFFVHAAAVVNDSHPRSEVVHYPKMLLLEFSLLQCPWNLFLGASLR